MDYGQIIELLIRALPYPDQMRRIDFDQNYVEFDWRGSRYRVDCNASVNEVRGSCLVGGDRAILLRKCLDSIRAYDAAFAARAPKAAA